MNKYIYRQSSAFPTHLVDVSVCETEVSGGGDLDGNDEDSSDFSLESYRLDKKGNKGSKGKGSKSKGNTSDQEDPYEIDTEDDVAAMKENSSNRLKGMVIG